MSELIDDVLDRMNAEIWWKMDVREWKDFSRIDDMTEANVEIAKRLDIIRRFEETLHKDLKLLICKFVLIF